MPDAITFLLQFSILSNAFLKCWPFTMEQMAYLNDWALLESDHVNALTGAIEDLKAGTLRLPVTGRARVCIAAKCLLVQYLETWKEALA